MSDSPLEPFRRQLAELAAEREQATPEQHGPNDFYGHARVLKEFAGLPAEEPLRFSIQHGIRLDLDFWAQDFHREHAVGVVHSQWRAEVVAPQVQRRIVPIGPYIHYARPLLAPDALAAARTALGRTLLVFPAHSTHWLDTAYNIGAFCDGLDARRAEFQTIFVCLYWKDVLRGTAEFYEQRGFPCVTAGHMFESDFLHRQRTFIELADATLSNQIGTHIGYCLHLGRPHQLIEQEISLSTEVAARMAETSTSKRLEIPRYYELFRAAPTRITDEQRALVGKYWGFDDLKTPDQLRALADSAVVLHRRRVLGQRVGRWLAPLTRFLPGR